MAYAYEQENQAWVKQMTELLQAMVHAVHSHPGSLSEQRISDYIAQYRALLERLIHYETATLRFLTDPDAPFTNNQGEDDIRMTKLHQKISSCFRSQKGADIFAGFAVIYQPAVKTMSRQPGF